MKVQGQTIVRVNKTQVQSSNNIAISMSNGDTHWVNLKYVNSILDSNFLAGASPKALEGSVVTYEKRTHKAGDKVTNEDGTLVEGKTFSKDGYRILSFRVEELGAKAEKMEIVAFEVAKKHSLSGAFSVLTAPAPQTGVKGSDTQHSAIEQAAIADKVGAEKKETVSADDIA